MNLDENALLKNMISGIDVNDGNKVPSSAYIHTLVNRIGMGTELSGFDNLTAAVNSVNNNLGNLFILKDYPFDSIMYVDNTVHGFYSCGPNLKNLPVSTYGMALVCQNQPGKWIFIIFIPTSADTIYVNFYNGYSGDSAGWTGWNSVPLSKKQ